MKNLSIITPDEVKTGDPIGEILTECSQNLKAGFSLAESFKEWIPDQELSIIESCDKARKLADGFKNAMIIAEGTDKISGSVWSTLLNFGYIQSLAIGLVAIFCITLVPTIKQSVPLEKWNTLQTGVWYFYVAITDYWYLMLAVVVALAVTVYRSLSVWTGISVSGLTAFHLVGVQAVTGSLVYSQRECHVICRHSDRNRYSWDGGVQYLSVATGAAGGHIEEH